MSRVADWFREGMGMVGNAWELAFINFLLTLVNVNNMVTVASFPGFRVVFTFVLPTVIPTLWSFMSQTGISISTTGLQSLTPLALAEALIYIIIASPLQYMYIYYMIKYAVKEQPRVVARRVVDILIYNLILLLLILTIASAIYVSIALATLMLMIAIIIYYLTYATPYIIMTRNTGVTDALRIAVNMAMKGDYLTYTIIYGIITLFISPILSTMAYVGKWAGIVIAAIIEAPIGLWLSITTLLMTKDHIKA